MRKELLVLGIALLFIGIIATSVAANIQEEKIFSTEEVDKKTATMLRDMASWSVSGNFTKGRKLYSYIQPGVNWRASDPGPDINFLKVKVTIHDPNGGETELKAIFSSDPLAPEPVLQPHAVQLVSNNGGLTFEKSNELEKIDEVLYYKEISGIVNSDGPYNVTVYPTFGASRTDPPSILGLQSQLTGKEYSYWFVIPVGAGFVVAGVFLSVRARKSPQHKKRLRTGIR